MSNTAPAVPVGADRNFHRFVWLIVALFLSYLSVAISLPVMTIFVTERLGYGNGLGGLAVGTAFASTIMTRGWAGRLADHGGSKACMVRGLWIYAAAALVCGVSSLGSLPGPAAYTILVSGRLLLGVGESLTVVGVIAWCFGIMGPSRSGLVFALVGMALYGAFAVGSPIGVALYEWGGFAGVMAASAIAPMLGLAMALPIRAVLPHVGDRPAFWRIIGRIWGPGAALALSGVGSATIGAFVPVHFLHEGWPHAGLGLTCFGGAFVLVRILFGNLPDRLGAMPVALVSIAVEAAGQYFLWTAQDPNVALAGAFLTGLGCSLMFPAIGIEVIQRVPLHLRGTAAGGLAGFQDLAFGVTGPATGLLADRFGYGVVFLIGGLAASVGFAVVIAIARTDRELTE